MWRKRPFPWLFLALALFGCGQPVMSPNKSAVAHTAPVPEHHGLVVHIACTRDGATFAYGNDENNIYLIDVATGTERAVLRGHTSFIAHLALSPDEKTLASAGDDGTVRLWNINSGAERAILRGLTDAAVSVAFSNDGKVVAAGGADHTLRFWDVATGRAKAVGRGANDYVLAFSPDDTLVATGGINLKLWRTATGDVAAEAKEDTLSSIHVVQFAPNGKMLASARFDDNVELWSVQPLKKVSILRGHRNPVYCVAFSPDQRMLASGDADHLVKLWDLASGRELATLQGGHRATVGFLQFSNDSQTLLSASYDGVVERWNVRTHESIGPGG